MAITANDPGPIARAFMGCSRPAEPAPRIYRLFYLGSCRGWGYNALKLAAAIPCETFYEAIEKGWEIR